MLTISAAIRSLIRATTRACSRHHSPLSEASVLYERDRSESELSAQRFGEGRIDGDWLRRLSQAESNDWQQLDLESDPIAPGTSSSSTDSPATLLHSPGFSPFFNQATALQQSHPGLLCPRSFSLSFCTNTNSICFIRVTQSGLAPVVMC